MVRAIQDDPTPAYDVPFICESCRSAFGSNAQAGAFPSASVCEFKYPNNREPWRIFVCCEDAARRYRESFGLVAEYFKTVWRRNDSLRGAGQVADSTSKSSDA